MFENLSDRLQNAIHKIKGYGKITEDNNEGSSSCSIRS